MVPYAEGTLDERSQSRVEKHLESCAACRQELECVRSVSNALRTDDAPAVEPSPDLWARVREQIQAQPARKVPSRAPQAAYAFAAMVLVGIVGWGLFRTQMAPEDLAQVLTPERVVQSEKPDIAKATTEAPAARSGAADSEPVQSQTASPRSGASKPASGHSRAHHSPEVREIEPSAAESARDAGRPVLTELEPVYKGDTALGGTAPGYGRGTKADAADAALSAPKSDRALALDAAKPAPSLQPSTAPTVGLSLSSEPNLSSEDYLKIANSQMVVGDSANAASNFYNAIKVEKPSRWRVVASQVQQSGALGLVTANAEKSFNTSQDAKSGLVLYELQAVQNDQSGMLNTAQQLVDLDPKSPLHWLKLGEAYESVGNPPQALNAYGNAAKGNDPEVASIARKKSEQLRKSSGIGQP